MARWGSFVFLLIKCDIMLKAGFNKDLWARGIWCDLLRDNPCLHFIKDHYYKLHIRSALHEMCVQMSVPIHCYDLHPEVVLSKLDSRISVPVITRARTRIPNACGYTFLTSNPHLPGEYILKSQMFLYCPLVLLLLWWFCDNQTGLP